MAANDVIWWLLRRVRNVALWLLAIFLALVILKWIKPSNNNANGVRTAPESISPK